MRRFVSLVLISLCLVGQSWSHSHTEYGMSEPDGHSAQPHIHLRGEHRHEHGHHHGHTHKASHHHGPAAPDRRHGANDPAVPKIDVPLTDHDQDAVYLVDLAYDGRCHVLPLTVDSTRLAGTWSIVPALRPLFPTSAGVFDLPDPYGGLPIFLRTASLRI